MHYFLDENSFLPMLCQEGFRHLCGLGTLGFPLVVLSSFVHFPAQNEAVVANFIMSIHLIIVAMTFAMVHPAIRTGGMIGFGALVVFFGSLFQSGMDTHCVAFIRVCRCCQV